MGVLILIAVSSNGNGLIETLEKDTALYFPLVIVVFSIPSFIYNLEKLYRKKKPELYNILRYGDLMFSVILCSSTALGGYYSISRIANGESLGSSVISIYGPTVIFSVIFIFGLLIFFDHFRFHRFLNTKKTNHSIDNIGKG